MQVNTGAPARSDPCADATMGVPGLCTEEAPAGPGASPPEPPTSQPSGAVAGSKPAQGSAHPGGESGVIASPVTHITSHSEAGGRILSFLVQD